MLDLTLTLCNNSLQPKRSLLFHCVVVTPPDLFETTVNIMTQFSRPLIIIFVACVVSPVRAQTTVDDFSDGPLMLSPMDGTLTQTALDPQVVAGGVRTTLFLGFPAQSPATTTVNVSGEGVFSYDGTQVNSFVEGPILQYGVSNLTAVTDSIAPLNLDLSPLSAGALEFDFLSYNIPSNAATVMLITLFSEGESGGPNINESVLVDVQSSSDPFQVSLPLLAFEPTIDLSNVDGIYVLFGTPQGTSFVLQSIRVVPEPSGGSLLCIAFIALSSHRHRTRCSGVRCSSQQTA